MIRRLLSCVLLCILFPVAQANIANPSTNAKVEYKDKRFYVDYTIEIKSSPRTVISTLTNYSGLNKLIPSITNSSLLEKHDDYDLVETHFSSCILLFCKKAVNTQKISHNSELIRAVTLVERSDFKYGLMTWEVQSISDATYIKYHAEVEPKFWVPPFIGPAIIKHKLKNEADIVSKMLANT